MRIKPEKRQIAEKSSICKKTAFCDFCHRSFTQKSLESHILVCRVATGISQKRLKKQKVSKKSAVPEKAEALDTFNLKEDCTIPVTKKPPLQIGVSKKMSHKLPEFQAELDYHDSSARSSPSVSNMSEKSDKNHEEWVVVEPKADKEFLENVRKRIMSCVNLNIAEDEKPSDDSLVNGNNETNVESEIYQQNETDESIFYEFPERNDISAYVSNCKLFDDSYHSSTLLKMIKSYVIDAKKSKILNILDSFLTEPETEDGSDVEDALFLISEVLYGK